MKIVKFFIVSLFFAASLFGFEEGVDYKVLNKPLDVPKNSVVKVFSYACLHCYKFDKTVTSKIFKAVPEVEFIPFHLRTKGRLGESASSIFAAMIAIDEKNGVGLLEDNSKFKKAKFATYKATHDKSDDFDAGKDKARFFKSVLGAAGVSLAEYEEALKTDRAQEILSSWTAGYDVAAINGVPAYVIAGKYLVEVSKIGSIDNFSKLIKELVAK